MVSEERAFSSGQVQRATELTYRQINDWDDRGVLPHSRSSDRGWRKYSAREVFVLMVANELHRRFGTPVGKVRYVTQFMMQEGADHLRAAIDLMAILGVDIWLMTDFEDTFVMDSELEFDDLMQYGLMGGLGGDGFVMLKINPLVNKLLTTLELEELPKHGRGYEILAQLRERVYIHSESEQQVLKAIRSESFSKVEVVLQDGTITTIRTTEHADPQSVLSKLLREHPYQTMTVHMNDGQIVSVSQQKTHRPERDRTS